MRIFLTTLLALVVLAPAAAADWPMYRFDAEHRAFDSKNTDFVLFKQQWWNNVTLPAAVKGSPIVSDGRVFIGTWNSTSSQLYALDSESGSILWNVKVSGRVWGAPAATDAYVYVVTEGGSLHAFDVRTGAAPLAAVSVGATLGSPVIHGNRIFVANKAGSVSAYEGHSLQKVWTFTLSGNQSGIIVPTGEVEGTPVVYSGQIMFGASNHYFYSVDEQGTGDGKTTLKWIFKADGAIRTSPAIDTANNRVIFGAQDGQIYAVSTTSGGNLGSNAAWKHKIVSGLQIQSSPAVAYGKVFFGTNDGGIYAISTAGGTTVWGRASGGAIVSSPAVANHHVVVGSGDRSLYVLNQTTGEVEWSRAASAAIDSSPAISGTQAFWASADGALFSWGGDKPARADLSVMSVAATLTQGESGTVSATVKNIGMLPAPATEVKFFAGTASIGSEALSALEAGAQKKISIEYSPKAKGTLALKIQVDPTNAIRELDEGNNIKVQTVSVRAPAPTDATTGGATSDGGAPGLELVIMILIIGAVAWARRRRA